MMGRNHLIAGTAIATGCVAWAVELRNPDSAAAQFLDSKTSWLIQLWPNWLGGFESTAATPGWAVQPVSTWVENVTAWFVPMGLLSPWGIVYAALATALFLLGSLLPDIDSKESILGQRFHVPGPHHGLTHTDWFLAGLLLISVPGFTRVLIWLWLGAVLHGLMDGLSGAGRARFYPLGKYKMISLPGGGGLCVMAGGKRLVLYRVGELSEILVLVGVLAASMASVVIVLAR